MYRLFTLLTASAVIATLPGCGESLIKVNGVVTLDGAPVDRATVTFVSEKGDNSYIGRTDSSGQFSIGAGEKVGAPAGNYKVLVVKTPIVAGVESMTPGSPEYAKMMEKSNKEQGSKGGSGGMIPMGPMMKPGMAMGGGPKSEFAKSLLPTEYGNVESTPLSVKVPPPSLPVQIELKSKK